MKPLRHALLLTVLLAAGLALASGHPWRDYDNTRGRWIRGVIQSSFFERPHQVIELQETVGAHQLWRVVLAAPSRMESRGLDVSRLVPGLAVRVFVYPAIDIPDEGRALRIDINGQVTELW
ncbi:MAG TPA: hypothetical protein VFI53_02510 [Myxococcaceae bacterium]|nr:hypothetical protein [Myxococcaceae bacterium]